MIFSVDKHLETAIQIESGNFTDFGIWERRHIQEWIRQNTDILGEDLLIVSMEFDRFANSNDRLDLLALDTSGNLVVVELKRDLFAGYADLQALRYAAMVSSMTIDQLAHYYSVYKSKYDSEIISLDDAKSQLLSFVDAEEFSDLSSTPRIILCSEGFSQELTTTVLWLRNSEIDISCVSITPYKVDDKYIIVPKVIIPLDETEQYMVQIKRKEEREKKARKYAKKSLIILLENGAVQAEEEIRLKSALPSHVNYDQNDDTFKAFITGKTGQSNGIRWAKDGKEYSISKLTWCIFKDLHPEQEPVKSVNGTAHWVNFKGESLWSMAKEIDKLEE